jgi:tetratricopeptide (TPR) repeat protein
VRRLTWVSLVLWGLCLVAAAAVFVIWKSGEQPARADAPALTAEPTELVLAPTAPPSATPAVAPSATPTETAIPTETPTPTPSPTPTPVYQPAQPAVELTGFTHAWQTWNNCGPATLAMQLSYFGSTLSQTDIAAVLRPNYDDKNADPEELADFAISQGLGAIVGVQGDRDTVRLLLSNGFPILIATWHEPEPDDGMGHYRLLTGYNDAEAYYIVHDSYDTVGLRGADPYLGLALPYDELEAMWTVFNRVYVVVYRPEQESLVRSILGPEVGTPAMWESALARAQEYAQAHPDDVYAWFNVGSNLTQLGRYAEAVEAYRQAESIGWPRRMLWYQVGPMEAYYHVGDYEKVIALTDQVMAQTNQVEEVWYWRGMALKGKGQVDAARQAFERSLALRPTFELPKQALQQQ